MVLRELVMACRLADSPTSLSPFRAKATTEGGGPLAFGVLEDKWFSTFHHSHAGIRRSKVDAQNVCHRMPFEPALPARLMPTVMGGAKLRFSP